MNKDQYWLNGDKCQFTITFLSVLIVCYNIVVITNKLKYVSSRNTRATITVGDEINHYI